jgi:hypothetical protein
MDDRFDNRSESEEGPAAPHLTLEQLTAYLDGDVTTGERDRLDEHLRSCGECRRELASLRATVVLLRSLPTYRPRRSFQLTPEAVATARPWWERLGLRLLPALPAFRAAVVATAILLAAVSAGDVIRDRNEHESPPRDVSLVQPTTQATTETVAGFAPTATGPAEAPASESRPPAQTEPAESGQADAGRQGDVTPTAAPRAGGGLAGAAAPKPTEASGNETQADEVAGGDTSGSQDTSGDTAEIEAAAAGAPAPATETPAVGDGDTESIAMAAVAEATVTPETTAGGEGGRAAASNKAVEGAAPAATPSPAPTASPSPVPSPTAVPATPTAVPATPATDGQPAAHDGDDGMTGWRLAQIGLAVLLLWLVVTVAGLQRLRRRR